MHVLMQRNWYVTNVKVDRRVIENAWVISYREEGVTFNQEKRQKKDIHCTLNLNGSSRPGGRRLKVFSSELRGGRRDWCCQIGDDDRGRRTWF